MRIAHAKPRQEYGVKPQRAERGESPDAGRGADAERERGEGQAGGERG